MTCLLILVRQKEGGTINLEGLTQKGRLLIPIQLGRQETGVPGLMAEDLEPDSRCQCGHLMITDPGRGEKGCTVCGMVVPLEVHEQVPSVIYDKDGNRVGPSKIAKVGTETKKWELAALGIQSTSSYHFSDQRLDGIIRLLQRRAERRVLFQDREKTEMVLSMIDKRVRHIYATINEYEQKDAAMLGYAYKPVYPTKSVLDDLLRQVFRRMRMPYSDRTKKRGLTHGAGNLTEYQKRWLANQKKEKRGRKKGRTFTNYALWEYHGGCLKCGTKLQQGQSVAGHMKKHHPGKTVQSGYNWFRRRPAGTRTDAVVDCPRCGQRGCLYRRSNGYYVFQHYDSSQHYVTKDTAEMVIENMRYRQARKASRECKGATAKITGEFFNWCENNLAIPYCETEG